MLSLAAGLTLAAAPAPRGDTAPVTVLLRTSAGEIAIEVDRAHAPITAANFLRYVDAGSYDGGRFHRTVTMANQPDNQVKIEVIQGGVGPAQEGAAREGAAHGGDDFAPIPLERTTVTGLAHHDGTVSMARDQPDTATSDFFICIGDQPSLDFGGARNPDGQGFAAFGRVVSGMGRGEAHPGRAGRGAEADAPDRDPRGAARALSARWGAERDRPSAARRRSTFSRPPPDILAAMAGLSARNLLHRLEYGAYSVVAGITQRLPLPALRAWAERSAPSLIGCWRTGAGSRSTTWPERCPSSTPRRARA
jgi:peptidyl-prolyl cis-trans isomerase A (cyclophilin A)